MREHHRHDCIRFELASLLLKNGCHPVLVVAAGKVLRTTFLAGKPRGVSYRFAVLVCEVRCKQVGIKQPRGTLQPNVEKIREFRVHDVVVIRRVHHNAIH